MADKKVRYINLNNQILSLGGDGILSFDTIDQMVQEPVATLSEGTIAWVNDPTVHKYFQYLSENTIDENLGRWKELIFGTDFQIFDSTVSANDQKYVGRIIQYCGETDTSTGFIKGCFYESRLTDKIDYVVVTLSEDAVGTYYTKNDEGNYSPITFNGTGENFDPNEVYYTKQEISLYNWVYINSLKVENVLDLNSQNAISNGAVTAKFDEVIQDYTDKNDELREYVDNDLTTSLQQYTDNKIDDTDEEVFEDKTWSSSKTKEYVDTSLEDYQKNEIQLTQSEYNALTDEEKNNGLEYRTTDTNRIYQNGMLFGEKRSTTLTYADYKALEENNEVETDVDYIITSNESGALLSDLDTNHGDSNVSTYEVIEELKSEVTTLQEDITELANKEDVYTTDSIANTLYYACEYFGLDCRNQYQVLEVEVIDAKGKNLKFNSIYKHEVLHHAQVISENGITLKAIDTVGTLAFENASDYTIKVKHIDICPDSVGDTLVTVINRANKNALVSDIVGTKTLYRGSQSVDITTGGKLTLIYSSEYASQAGCYMLLSNYNTKPLLIELGRYDIGQFKVTATHKSNGVDTITVTAGGDAYSWYVLQF